MACPVGGRAAVSAGRWRIREAVRQRDHPRHRRRRNLPQAPGAAGAPGERAARPVHPHRPRELCAPGRAVARPDHRQPGRRLPYPRRRRPGPLVPDRVVDDPAGPGRAVGHGPCEGPDRGGHQRRPHGSLAYRRTRQPRRRAAPVRIRPHRHRQTPRRASPPRPDPPAALGQTPRPRGRGREPRLPNGEDPGEARPPQTLPQPHLRHAHLQATGPGSCPWQPNSASPSSPSTRPTPPSGAPSTGRSPSPARPGRPLATTQPPWRSADAPWGTRSGDGRHRPHTTGAIVWGIGPSRPDRASQGGRETAPASPDHGHDPCAPDAAENAVDQNAQHRSGHSAEHGSWQQDSLPLSL